MTLSVVDQALERALETRETIYVRGGPGSGKSSIALELAKAAGQGDRKSVLVAAPSGAPDAGVLALASAARQIGHSAAGIDTWEEFVPTVRKQLLEQRDEFLIVLDEPSSWGASGGIFHDRAEDAIRALSGPETPWPTIVCDQGRSDNAIVIPSATTEDLATEDWGLLSDGARDLRTSGLVSKLATPLEVRLAVALMAWDAEPQSTVAHRLALQLASVLSSRRHGTTLWGLWQKLALARTPIDGDMLVALGSDRLTPLARKTLEVALLDGANRLHDVLRTIPEDRPPDPEVTLQQRRNTHELLFEYHYSLEVSAAETERPDPSVDHGAEALFHAGELGDQDRIGLIPVDFSEQLSALGHRLGQYHRRSAEAVIAYRRVLQNSPQDPNDLYSLAYYLDVQGLDASEVEDHYRRAVRADPLHPRWHAHLVSFLADRARPAAARIAWASAESALADDRARSDLYRELHIPVAASLLAIGELAFSAYVLSGVPHSFRDASWRDLRALVSGRLAGQGDGAFVPAPRSGREWWLEGPSRLPQRDTDKRELTSWMAGRVEAVDSEQIEVHVAQVRKGSGDIEPGLLDLPTRTFREKLLDDFDIATLSVGRFIEVGRYSSSEAGERTGIMVLPLDNVQFPVDVLPAVRWQSEFADALA